MSTTSKQPTVRVNTEAKRKLDKMQEQTDLSHPALLDRAISLLERELLADQLEADLIAIASDEDALRTYKSIVSDFDDTVGDGI